MNFQNTLSGETLSCHLLIKFIYLLSMKPTSSRELHKTHSNLGRSGFLNKADTQPEPPQPPISESVISESPSEVDSSQPLMVE